MNSTVLRARRLPVLYQRSRYFLTHGNSRDGRPSRPSIWHFALVIALASLAPAAATAEEACGLCNTEVVTNSSLAECFLQDYAALAAGDGPVLVVDLGECETSRALAQALPSPVPRVGAAAEPDVQFMVSRVQLACLKRKLEEPGLVLDPSARIDLNDCE